jgi:hypothetical protein
MVAIPGVTWQSTVAGGREGSFFCTVSKEISALLVSMWLKTCAGCISLECKEGCHRVDKAISNMHANSSYDLIGISPASL